MKKLLTTITLSALLGTSASNLKPLFTNNVVSHNFKSNQLNKDISIKNQNDKKPFDKLIIKENFLTSSIFSLSNGTIYVGTKNQGLWKSTDGITFAQVTGLPNDEYINDTKIAPNGTIYVGTNGKGLWKSIDGLNFNQVNDIPNDYFVSSIVCSKDGKIFVGNNSSGSQKGVYKSTDGITFKKMLGTSEQIQCLTIDKDDNVYAGTTNSMGDQGVIYKSDGTNDFTEITKFTGAVNSLAIDSSNNVYAGTEVYKTKQGNVYKSTDGIYFSEMSGVNISISSLAIDKNDNVYAGTTKGLYKSNGANEFSKVYEVSDDDIVNSVTISKNGAVYVGTQNKGLYITNPINLLVDITKPDTFDKSWPLYSGIVYNSAQKIDIKENLVASATLDNKSITIPTTDISISVGEHNLILTLKDKSLASVFGGDTSTGKVTYKLWVKTSIDKNKIDYQTKIDDTQLYTGLVSNAGNTNNADIIQTKIKDGTGKHDASLNIDFKDILIDFDVNKSFYEQGTVDETTNDFTATGSKQGVSKNLSIQNDGTYHLHLVDTVGNNYDSYLELGESNWKLKGDFNDSELDKLKSKLNVTVNLTDPTQKSKALGWLHQYENFAENKFNDTIKTNGKGFDSEIKNQIISYTTFLKPLTYNIANEPKFNDGLDKDLLVKTITDKAKEILNKGLDALPKNLNVNTSNVVNKSTLGSYTSWINGYQKFINDNKDRWISDVAKIASRGFAKAEQENQIKEKIGKFLNNDNIRNYLKEETWTPNLLLNNFNNNTYLQYIKLDKLKSDTIDWVNTNMKEINLAYQNAITQAESGLNLHGYSIDKILNSKQKPQTKNEIDKFADGQSYHDWLQSQANIKFRGWQLAMGFGIAIPLLLVVFAIAWVIRSRTNPKYNPIARGKKIKREKIKAKKAEMKNDNKEK